MRIPNIYKVAFFALIFCLLNIFTVVMSNDIEKAAANLGSIEEYSSLTNERNETGIYENPLINNNQTTDLIRNSATIPFLENAVKNQTLADPIDVSAEFVTNRLKKNSTAQSYKNDEFVVDSDISLFRNSNVSILSDNTSKINNTEGIQNPFSKCCSKSLLFQQENLEITSIINWNKSNQNSYNSRINNIFTLVKDFIEENSKLNKEQFQTFKKTFCERVIVKKKEVILMELVKDLKMALDYCNPYQIKKVNNSEIYNNIKKIVQTIYEDKNNVLPETIQETCNYSSLPLIQDLMFIDNDLNMFILVNLKRIFSYLLHSSESKKYSALDLLIRSLAISGIIKTKEERAGIIIN